MAFMNKKRPNKIVLYVLVAMISIGLLGSVSIGFWAFSSGSYSSGTAVANNGSSEAKGNAYFSQAMDKLLTKNDVEGAQKLFKDAIVEYEKALKETPQNKLVLGDLATAYFYTGNTDKAIELVRQALKIDPNFAQARFNYAIYLGDGKKQYMDAIKELQKIKTGDPRYQDAQNLIKQYFEAMSGPKNK